MAEPWKDKQIIHSAQGQVRSQGFDRQRQRPPVSRTPGVSQPVSLYQARNSNMQNQVAHPTFNLAIHNKVELPRPEEEQQAGNAKMIADANSRRQQASIPAGTPNNGLQLGSITISENKATSENVTASKLQRNYVMNKDLISRAKDAAITKNEAKDMTQNNIICDAETLQMLLANGIEL